MPFIRVTTPASLLTEAERDEIAEKLTIEIMRIETEGGDTPGFRAISALVFEEVAPRYWSIGGKRGNEPAAVVEIRVPHGALRNNRRDLMAQATYRVLTNVNQKLASVDGYQRIWTHMFEMGERNWGAGDRVVTLPDVRRVAAGESIEA